MDRGSWLSDWKQPLSRYQVEHKIKMVEEMFKGQTGEKLMNGDYDDDKVTKNEEGIRFLLGMADQTSPGNNDAHYRGKIEPIDYIEDQRLGPHEANIIKYVSRWQRKGGVQDLYKAAWYLMRLVNMIKRQEEEKTNE